MRAEVVRSSVRESVDQYSRRKIEGKREAETGAPEGDAASRVLDVGTISLCGCARERQGEKTGLGGAAGVKRLLSPSTGEA